MTEPIEPLSQHLLQELRSIEDSFVDDAPPSEREEMRRWRDLLSELVDHVLRSKQTLVYKSVPQLEYLIHVLGDRTLELLDARYAEEMLTQVPRFAARTVKLATLESKYPASDQTNLYLHEAAKAYIFGLPLASVAMSRVAMEQSLRDRLGYQQTDERIDFDVLVKEAQKYGLVPRTRRDDGKPAIRVVNTRCNNVMHEKPVSDDEAFEILSAARSVIEELHSKDGTP